MAKPTWVYLAGAARKIWRWSDFRKRCRGDASECAKCGTEFYVCKQHVRKRSKTKCSKCKLPEIDHINPVGSPPRDFNGWDDYYKKMFEGKLQALCHKCHQKKTQAENKLRKQELRRAA